jgi:hypothetical protein
MKMLTPAGVLGWFLFLACSSAFAQGGIYKWTDAKGSIHFSNTPTHEAETVDDILPPAANFERPTEPALPSTASTRPLPRPPAPPANVNERIPSEDEAPPPPSEPTAVVDPTAADSPGLPPGGPIAEPAPAAGTQPTLVGPSDSEDSESETE